MPVVGIARLMEGQIKLILYVCVLCVCDGFIALLSCYFHDIVIDHSCMSLLVYIYIYTPYIYQYWDSLLVERCAHDRKVASSNPCRTGGRFFFSRVNFLMLTFIWCPFHPHDMAMACKRPRSFCQKCRWQFIPKRAYTLDPTKWVWAD